MPDVDLVQHQGNDGGGSRHGSSLLRAVQAIAGAGGCAAVHTVMVQRLNEHRDLR